MKSCSSCISFILIPLLVVSPLWAQTPAMNPAASADLAVPGQLQLRLAESDGSRVVVGSRAVKGISVHLTDANGAAVSDAAVAFRFPDTGATARFADGSHSAVAYTDATGTAHVGDFQWSDTPGPIALRITASKGNSHAGVLLEQTLVGAPAAALAEARPVAVATNETEAALPATPASDEVLAPVSRPAVSFATIGGGNSVNPYRAARLGIAPAISIKSRGSHDTGYHPGINKKKWIMLAIIAGAGAGVAFAAMNGKSAATTGTSTSGLTVGAPTISIGHP